jgi:DMSO/TMAO reductase YedYZ molybdopterin-dependent catalytic subunit
VAAVKLDPQTFFRRIPLAPHQLRDRITRTEDAIVLCHLGVPHLDREQWSLTIDGLVEHPRTLRFDDLKRYPKAEIASFHQCAGSPLQPFEPTRRVCNVVWGGVRLGDLLAECRPSASARYVWSSGADFGEFGGVTVDAYVKDLPIARAQDDVLIATEMNGDALPPEHGFPARLVVPGFYGTNSVKWLTRMTLAESRAASPFTTRWYNDPVRDDTGRETTTPVWSIAPESLIVAPAPDARIAVRAEQEVWGWAWADGGVASVEVRTADDAPWLPAPRSSRPKGGSGSVSRSSGCRAT